MTRLRGHLSYAWREAQTLMAAALLVMSAAWLLWITGTVPSVALVAVLSVGVALVVIGAIYLVGYVVAQLLIDGWERRRQ